MKIQEFAYIIKQGLYYLNKMQKHKIIFLLVLAQCIIFCKGFKEIHTPFNNINSDMEYEMRKVILMISKNNDNDHNTSNTQPDCSDCFLLVCVLPKKWDGSDDSCQRWKIIPIPNCLKICNTN